MAEDASEAPSDDDLQKRCKDEFDAYLSEREGLTKAELDSERSFDTLLVTLSTLAIGSSFTILKDILRTGPALLIILAWAALGACLLIALVDKLLTYKSHEKWRDMLDRHFDNWSPGAMARAMAEYPTIPFASVLPYLKWFGLGSLLLGVLFLMLFVFIAPRPEERAQTPTATMNVYNNYAATQPAGHP